MNSSVQAYEPVHEKIWFSSIESPNDHLRIIIASIPCACFNIEWSRNYMTLISPEVGDRGNKCYFFQALSLINMC